MLEDKDRNLENREPEHPDDDARQARAEIVMLKTSEQPADEPPAPEPEKPRKPESTRVGDPDKKLMVACESDFLDEGDELWDDEMDGAPEPLAASPVVAEIKPEPAPEPEAPKEPTGSFHQISSFLAGELAGGVAMDSAPSADSNPKPPHEEKHVAPFFDIPEKLPHIPSEDTEDFPETPTKKRRRGPFRPLFVLFNLLTWFFLLAFFAAAGAALLYVRYARTRLYDTQTESSRVVDFTVQPGETFAKIVDHLRNEELLGSFMLVDDGYLMRYLAHVNDNSNKIKPGVYRLNASMGLDEIYDRLVKGSQDFKVTIPEGKTLREVASIVKKRNEAFDEERFMELTKDASFIQSLGMNVDSLEGYLYPNTYFFGPGMKEEDLIKMMVNLFREKVEPALAGIVQSDELTFQQHLIMASLIEREARIDSDRPLIASVMFNRLKANMPLGIDASIRYALNEWKRPLTITDTKIDSPYNTYKVPGLPPGPICSPRLASLMATYQAPATDFLYYLYKGDNSHVFAKTYEEHLANKRLYRAGKTDIAAGPGGVKAPPPGDQPPPIDDAIEPTPPPAETPAALVGGTAVIDTMLSTSLPEVAPEAITTPAPPEAEPAATPAPSPHPTPAKKSSGTKSKK